MRKLFSVFGLLLFLSVGAQFNNEGNSFSEGETTQSDQHVVDPGDEDDPNPGDPIPIDNYIPLLAGIGMVIILYSSRKRISKI